MSTTAVFFPFSLFGSAGAGAGAELLADAFREMLADNRREKVPTRARAYKDQVRVRELAFETVPSLEKWRERGRQAVRQTWGRGEFLLWVTGNHLGTLPLYDELSGDADALVVQFDAHLDVYNLSDCKTELSHGNFLLHCGGPVPPTINVGHRELLLCPDYVEQYYRRTHPAESLARDPDRHVKQLTADVKKARRVVIDIDCDVLDPVYFPAVTQPLPFGLSPHVLLRLLDAVWSEAVVAVAVSEFDPGRDRNDQSLATLVWLLEYLLLRRYER